MKVIPSSQLQKYQARPNGRDNNFVAWLVMPPAILSLSSFLWPASLVSSLAILCGCTLLASFFVSLVRFKNAFFVHTNLFFLVFFFFFPAIFLTNVVFWGGAATYDFNDTNPISMACIWLTLSNFGYYWSRGKNARTPNQSLVKAYRDAFGQTDWLNIALICALAIYFIEMSPRFLADRYQEQWLFNANITSRSRDAMFLVVLPKFIAFSSLISAVFSLAHRPSPFRIAIVAAAGLLWLAYNNPLSTPREFLLSQGILAALVVGLPQRRPMLFWCGMIFVLFVVGPIVSFYSREYVYTQHISFFNGADFDVYQNSVAFSRYLAVHGFAYGEVILRDLSFWLPREYKPGLEDLSAAVARGNGYLQFNISLAIFDEFFADFGYTGLILLSGATGYVLGISERYALDPLGGLQTPSGLALLFVTASYFGILRGPLIGKLPYVALGSGSIFVVALLSLRLRARYLSPLGANG